MLSLTRPLNRGVEMDKSHRGNASQFFVAGELCRRGLVAVVTLGNSPNTDILCSNRQGTKFVHIQVKTYRAGKDEGVTVGRKAELAYGENFVWVLSGIPEPDSISPFEYFIIPAKEVSKHVSEGHQAWLLAPGKKGQAHQDSSIRIIHIPPGKPKYTNWDIEQYKNNWSVITKLLQEG